MTTMKLDQARAVYWLRNNHRPLGELLDTGYLDEVRLRWAAERAYDPQLKAAAQVLLEHVQRRAAPQTPVAPAAPAAVQVVDAGISLEQARKTAWPFRPHKGQVLGGLVDTQQVGLKDLVYAIENAWDERVRRASVVLLAGRLNQVVAEPPPSAGPLKVVSGGRSYSRRQETRWTFINGMFCGIVAAVLLWIMIAWVRSVLRNPQSLVPRLPRTPVEVVALIIVLALSAAVYWIINRLFRLADRGIEREIDQARKGQQGEEDTLEVLRQALDGNWTIFQNVVLPGRNKGDIDAVLVGPPGVWALEIKNFSSAYRNFGEHWESTEGRGRKLLRDSPSRQAQNNAARLAAFLRADGLKQWVEPVVVWANRESPLEVEQPTVPVWTLDRLPEELGNLWQSRTVEAQVRTQIEEKLAAMCKRQSSTIPEGK